MSQAPRTNNQSAAVDQYLAGWEATMRLLREGKSFSGRERNCAFLNLGNGTFAHSSAISGFDYPDDGRAIASLDWDQDGELDLWVTNRTGPRLRFMHNNGTVGQSIQCLLQGTTCNRDAVGARVTVHFTNPAVPAMVRTLYAGDGYLSQSSKWLHFGIGQEQVREISVRWPGGVDERFSWTDQSARYILVQGSGVARAAPLRRGEVVLRAKPQPAVAKAEPTRTVLASRPPLPLLDYQDWNRSTQWVKPNSKPLLIIFWSSTCPACLKELWEFQQRIDDLAAVDLLALSIDTWQGNDPDDSRQWIEKRQIIIPSGVASNACGDKLNLLMRIVLNQQGSLAIPLSLLVDQDGSVSTLYRGTVSVEQVLSDVQTLTDDPEKRRNLAVPFAGTWITPPKSLLLRSMATVFREHGHLEDYRHYLRLDLERLRGQMTEGERPGSPATPKVTYATQYFDLARSLQQQAQYDEAIQHFEAGLMAFPGSALAHFQLAECLFMLKRSTEALRELEESLKIDPDLKEANLRRASLLREQGKLAESGKVYASVIARDPTCWEAHFGEGVTWAKQGDIGRAVTSFERVLTIRPEHVDALTNLAMLHAQQGELQKALAEFQKVQAVSPENLSALVGIANVLATAGRLDEAIQHLQQAVAKQPSVPQLRTNLARWLLESQRHADAVAQLEAAVAIDRTDGATLTRLAWLLATSPDERARNGARALEIAEALQKATQGKNWLVLDTLAAALAEQGKFADAITQASRARDMIRPHDPQLAEQVESRIRGYQSQKPFREEQ